MAITGEVGLVMPMNVIDEPMNNVSSKPFFKERVTMDSARLLERVLMDIAVRVVPASTTHARLVRDPKNDLLVTEEVLRDVDYVITGDRDLLDLGRVNHTRIVRPAEFLALLALER